jgi:hypothetical protein
MKNALLVLFAAGVLLLLSGCTRYYHFVQANISHDEAILTYNVGYHLVANSPEDENVFIERLMQKDLKALNLCSKGYVIDRKGGSRHLDYSWTFHCKK